MCIVAEARPAVNDHARRICLEEAGSVNRNGRLQGLPIRVIPGDQSPVIDGDPGHWTTPGGKPVYHPNAYRAAWGKPIYHCSTECVEVGLEWIEENTPDPTDEELAAIGGPRECRRAMEAVGPAEHAEWYAEEARLAKAARKHEPAVSREWLRWAKPGDGWREAKQRIAVACRPDLWHGETEDWTAAVWLEYAPHIDALLVHRQNQPSDDRRRIQRPYLLAKSEEGLIVGDRREDPREVQVIVRDATTGFRHAIPVPPVYGRVGSGHWRRLGDDAARVHAAIAWTFDLQPEQYHPSVEA
jgi:hypothetical protein